MLNSIVKLVKPRGNPAYYQQLIRCIQTEEISFPRPHAWNRAVGEAEKLVGFPTSMLSLRTLMNDDVTAMAAHMRKLMGTDHPILKTIKRLIYDEKINMQIRGLLILLMCRCINAKSTKAESESDFDAGSGVTLRQRQLAEYVEMIFAAQSIHKSVLNLPTGFHDLPESEIKSDLLQLEYGNKMAILGGDYLLANACTGLADLKNTYVVEMVSTAIADFTQSEFIGLRDVQGRFVPDGEQNVGGSSWEERNVLSCGNLMASGCKSAMLLVSADENVQRIAHRMGLNLSLALEAFTELQPFTTSDSVGTGIAPVDLSSAPVLFHLAEDKDLLEYVRSCGKENVEKLDFKRVFDAVSAGRGVDFTREMCSEYAGKALKDIDEICEEGSSKTALLKLVSFLANPW